MRPAESGYMPRDLPLGNGSLQINFDSAYRIVDLYYPYVGQDNHAIGHPFRMGLWVDGVFSWTDSPEWARTLVYLPASLVTHVSLTHRRLGLTLEFRDAIDCERNIFIRRLDLVNHAHADRQVKLFLHHDFYLSGTDVGDTAYVDPTSGGLFHYKGKVWVLSNVQRVGRVGFDAIATGTKAWGGREGTWRDAEDGELSGNPIAQGSVDSVGELRVIVPGGGASEAYAWVAVGESYEHVRGLHDFVVKRTPQALLHRTANYWRLWARKEPRDLGRLPASVVELYERSLLILRTQIDSRGAVIASTDSAILQFQRDTYNYMWPRDGALAARALDRAGYSDVTRTIYQFCATTITRAGYFLHKYRPDGSPGSSWHPWGLGGKRQFPIQEDETALVLWALWQHFMAYRDVEFIKSLYRPLIVRAANFMLRYRDECTGLPLPSYDLWEERQGIFSFTCGAVYGGLMAAAQFAEAFGELERALRYRQAAGAIKTAMEMHLFSHRHGRFVRRLMDDPQGSRLEDPTLDASLYGLFAFGAFEAMDPRVVATMEAVRTRLWVQTDVGGLARYEDDGYWQVSQDIARVPGNPWIICTLWLAEWEIRRASSEADLAPALELLEWVAAHARPSGCLPEQIHPYTGAPLSVCPLTWSHATFILAVLSYHDKLCELQRCPTCGNPTPRYRSAESLGRT
jgi:GH15 family glucan-1,4-alpha-glucosidase